MQNHLTNSTIGQLINTAKKDWPPLLIAHVQGVMALKDHMNNIVRVIFLSIILVACGNSIKEKRYTFEPLMFHGNDFVVVNERINKEHYDKVEVVLAFYNVKYERKAATEIIFSDGLLPELLMNFSNKAEDKVWLKQQGISLEGRK